MERLSRRARILGRSPRPPPPPPGSRWSTSPSPTGASPTLTNVFRKVVSTNIFSQLVKGFPNAATSSTPVNLLSYQPPAKASNTLLLQLQLLLLVLLLLQCPAPQLVGDQWRCATLISSQHSWRPKPICQSCLSSKPLAPHQLTWEKHWVPTNITDDGSFVLQKTFNQTSHPKIWTLVHLPKVVRLRN